MRYLKLLNYVRKGETQNNLVSLLCKNDIKILDIKFKYSQFFLLSYLNRNNNPTHGTNTAIPLLHRTKGTPQILKI